MEIYAHHVLENKKSRILTKKIGMQELSILKNGVSIYIFFVGIVVYILLKDKRRTYWFWFAIFLTLLGILDFLGGQISLEYNYFLYEYIVIPGQLLFYFWLFSKEKKIGKNLPLYLTILYITCLIIEKTANAFEYGLWFGSFSYCVGNICLLVLIVRYIYLLSTSDDILNFKNQPMFWVSIGLMVFWLGSLPYYGLFNYLYQNFPKLHLGYTWIVMLMNYLMYSFFICAILWQKEN